MYYYYVSFFGRLKVVALNPLQYILQSCSFRFQGFEINAFLLYSFAYIFSKTNTRLSEHLFYKYCKLGLNSALKVMCLRHFWQCARVEVSWIPNWWETVFHGSPSMRIDFPESHWWESISHGSHRWESIFHRWEFDFRKPFYCKCFHSRKSQFFVD